jgi:growth arrest-specific protein 1
MMKCNCEGDSFCERSKASVAPCQEEVVHAAEPGAVVSCTSAQWICAADPECSEALDCYKRLCRPMFKGRKCTKKCQNTIETLRSLSKRQNAAQTQETCYCDGTEDFKCDKIKSNMEALCFRNFEQDILSNEIGVDRLKSKKSSSSSLKEKFERILIIIVVFESILYFHCVIIFI